jgi:hypothetical protein|tara:strand:- start:444 stop:833 length:390 start_codon:yes stop_codon:yes gene_type:complete
MSHFSTIKTKIRKKPQLVEALELLQYDVKEDQELKVTGSHGIKHETVTAEVAISNDIGFRLNPMNNEYELVADLETWNQNITVERFIDKVTQQYARMTIHNSVKKQGFEVAEEWEMDDNSIEITVNRWV